MMRNIFHMIIVVNIFLVLLISNSFAGDNISGEYTRKKDKYYSGIVEINKVSANKIKVYLHVEVINGFSCELGEPVEENGKWDEYVYASLDNDIAIYSDDYGCKIQFRFMKNSVIVETNRNKCNSYCGVRAKGAMDGTYIKKRNKVK